MKYPNPRRSSTYSMKKGSGVRKCVTASGNKPGSGLVGLVDHGWVDGAVKKFRPLVRQNHGWETAGDLGRRLISDGEFGWGGTRLKG